MRKTLFALGAAAALAVSAGGASADPVTITFDGLCNMVTLNTTGNNVSALLSGTDCETGFGTGYNGKIRSYGNGTGLAVRFNGDATNYYLAISMPYVTGGTWRLYNTADGKTITSTNGTYTVNSAAEVHARGTKSVTSLLH